MPPTRQSSNLNTHRNTTPPPADRRKRRGTVSSPPSKPRAKNSRRDNNTDDEQSDPEPTSAVRRSTRVPGKSKKEKEQHEKERKRERQVKAEGQEGAEDSGDVEGGDTEVSEMSQLPPTRGKAGMQEKLWTRSLYVCSCSPRFFTAG